MGIWLIRLQSSMEYLVTWGWAILLISGVMASLFATGVFKIGQAASAPCMASSGYYCSSLTLASDGTLSASIGSFSTIMITGLGCSNSSAVPSSFSTANISLSGGNHKTVSFICIISSSVLGASFSGSLWIKYTQNGQTNLVAKVGSVSTNVQTQVQAWSPPAIAIDTASHSSAGAASALSWTHTVGSGLANSLLVVGVSIEKSQGATVSNVVYAGTPLTKAKGYTGTTSVRTEIWYLKNPQSGSANVVVTLTKATGTDGWVAGAVSFSGVDQTTPIPTTATSSTYASVSITTAYGNSMVMDNYAYDANSAQSASSPATAQWSVAATGMAGGASTKTTTAAGTYSMAWTGSSDNWAQVAAEIKQASTT